MKLFQSLLAVSVSAVLMGCNSDSGTPDYPQEGESRKVSIGFTVDKDINPMSETTIANQMENCGYDLKANDEVIESGVCIADNLTIEIRDGYKLELIHPTLSSALDIPVSNKWSVEGEHTIAIDENNITIKTANQHFSLVSIANSSHLNYVEINGEPAIEDEAANYGFVTGDTYTLLLNSQLGDYTDNDSAEVNTHYHYYLSDGDISIDGPGDEWEGVSKPIGGEVPPTVSYSTINIKNVEKQDESTLKVIAGNEDDQPSFLTKYPNVSMMVTELPTEVFTTLGWTDIYIYSNEMEANCRITVLANGNNNTNCDNLSDISDNLELSIIYTMLAAVPRTDYIDGVTRGNVFSRLSTGGEGAWGQEATISLK
ncbi:hypothetical protein BCU84_06435 [Shewanella sp. 10N.286.51.B7]|uniref:hypothetical protein n=1 Tax=Shewanella sp. 10N.286.51.B7 TaxID=1880836 RepID=UPI000C817B81|nr:hypothetical protein [Shewanella sp. 10N.286.51.B7]PMG78975.1 hypothetical protein BCU84_06435 [Shewanella sp. 10N.286.51.B7]